MKRIIINMFLMGFALGVYAQGYVALINAGNSSTNPLATSGGLFWLSTGGTPVLINQDFNAAFYAGTDSGSLSPLAIFLLSNGTALGDNTLGPGTFIDTTGPLSYPVPGSFDVAFFRIEAWTGNFNSYAAALNGGAPAAQSAVFNNPVSVPPGDPPSLTGMPAMVLSGIPEPSTFALAAVGGVCALLLGRWRKCTTRPRASR